MKKRFCTILTLAACLAVLALCAGGASAEDQEDGFLGKPFPDFTATDTEGNTFTLSEALKDHEAVLINLWATWCGPCMREFPFLNEAYEQYGDRVAFIALSSDPEDTTEMIAEYRRENGVSFPMGRDEGQELSRNLATSGIPVTVVVDRFGNAAFYHLGAFGSAKEPGRVLEAFLGDGYMETTVLDGIPKDSSTLAFPVSAKRTLYPENGTYRKITFYADVLPAPVPGWIVPDDSVRLRIEVAADDDVASLSYYETAEGTTQDVLNLLDPERGAYVYDQPMPLTEEEVFVEIGLFNRAVSEDENEFVALLFRSEETLNELTEQLTEQLSGEVRWEYAEDAADAKTENAPQAYILHVVDQDSNPVGEVTVNFCTDTACVPKESGEDGTITFTGDPDVYHVTIVDAPDGYSWDEEYEMYMPGEYGEWVLRVRKD